MRKKLLSLLTLFVAVGAVAQQRISLAGTWDFAIGETPSYNDHVTLPGSMLTNNKGDDVSLNTQWTGSLYDSSFYFNPYMKKYQVEGQMKFPFFLTPEKHYVGRAWYQRTVRVPKAWRRNRVTLFLERPHIETTLLVNGREVGHQMSLSTPHQYDVTDFVRFGKDNVITLIIYNGIENVCVGQDSHSVTDQTQGNWNGVTGRIELRAEPIIWRKRVYSDVEKKEVTIVINEQEYHFSLGSDAQLWDEFNPMLYTRNVVYKGDTLSTDRRGVVEGYLHSMRTIRAEPHEVPLLLPTRSRLCRRRPPGLLSATRRPVVAQSRCAPAPRSVHR